MLQQVKASHRLHVAVGDHQAVFAFLHLGESLRAVASVIDLLETELFEQIANDADHGSVLIHDQDRHCQIDSHGASRPETGSLGIPPPSNRP